MIQYLHTAGIQTWSHLKLYIFKALYKHLHSARKKKMKTGALEPVAETGEVSFVQPAEVI